MDNNNQTNFNNNGEYHYSYGSSGNTTPPQGGQYSYNPNAQNNYGDSSGQAGYRAPVINLSDNATSYRGQQPGTQPAYAAAAPVGNSAKSKKIVGVIIAVLAALLLIAIIAAVVPNAIGSGSDQPSSGITQSEDEEGGVVLNTEESPVTDTTVDEGTAEKLTYAQIAAYCHYA